MGKATTKAWKCVHHYAWHYTRGICKACWVVERKKPDFEINFPKITERERVARQLSKAYDIPLEKVNVSHIDPNRIAGTKNSQEKTEKEKREALHHEEIMEEYDMLRGAYNTTVIARKLGISKWALDRHILRRQNDGG